MGFFDKVKNKLGIGGVKVTLQIPGHVAKESEQVEGKVVLTTKSEQEIIEVEIKFVEEFTSGRGDNASTESFDLGVVKFTETYAVKPGEVKEIPFVLPFKLLKSKADSLAEKGGTLGAIGKMSKFASNEKSKYMVEANVDVKAAILDPSDKKDIKLT
ncbi:sporulation-control protein spo0M [Aquimarina sp. EL_43]|uniref:sporulation protein n=1 Tax=unclassified Aquimarina TaxID=2627091 RepID=UPI0018CB187F|nr:MULTISPECIES: sporulation protein [unclassified Aquimarina]MBG6132552.1 sporulation-control protein spo0M [Aquimarina sp. EL_35]MBG6152683.1 sporulation-control protein spo0M [Aquimarina sp. EL_32]MBG6170690.1 sporulation-control protein spo0M [Aquimarina sp. EL_43]